MIEKGEKKTGRLLLYMTGELSKSKNPQDSYQDIKNAEKVKIGSLLGDLNFSKFGFDPLTQNINNREYSINLEDGLNFKDLENDSFEDFENLKVDLRKSEYQRNKKDFFREKYICTKTCFVAYLDQEDISEILKFCKEKEEKNILKKMKNLHTKYNFLNFRRNCEGLTHFLNAKRDKVLVKENKKSDKFYFIKSGTVDIIEWSYDDIDLISVSNFMKLNGFGKNIFKNFSTKKKFMKLKILSRGSLINFEESMLKKPSSSSYICSSLLTELVEISATELKERLYIRDIEWRDKIQEFYETKKKKLKDIKNRVVELEYGEEIRKKKNKIGEFLTEYHLKKKGGLESFLNLGNNDFRNRGNSSERHRVMKKIKKVQNIYPEVKHERRAKLPHLKLKKVLNSTFKGSKFSIESTNVETKLQDVKMNTGMKILPFRPHRTVYESKYEKSDEALGVKSQDAGESPIRNKMDYEMKILDEKISNSKISIQNIEGNLQSKDQLSFTNRSDFRMHRLTNDSFSMLSVVKDSLNRTNPKEFSFKKQLQRKRKKREKALSLNFQNRKRGAWIRESPYIKKMLDRKMGMVREMKRYKKWVDLEKMIDLKSYEVYKVSAKISHRKLIEMKKTRRMDFNRKMKGFRSIIRKNRKRETTGAKLFHLGLGA